MTADNGAKPDAMLDAIRTLAESADKTERIVAAMISAVRRRRGLINADPSLRDIVVTMKLYPSSGHLRSVVIDLTSEEKLDKRG